MPFLGRGSGDSEADIGPKVASLLVVFLSFALATSC